MNKKKELNLQWIMTYPKLDPINRFFFFFLNILNYMLMRIHVKLWWLLWKREPTHCLLNKTYIDWTFIEHFPNYLSLWKFVQAWWLVSKRRPTHCLFIKAQEYIFVRHVWNLFACKIKSMLKSQVKSTHKRY